MGNWTERNKGETQRGRDGRVNQHGRGREKGQRETGGARGARSSLGREGRKGMGRGRPQVLTQEEMRRQRGGAWAGEEGVSRQGASPGAKRTTKGTSGAAVRRGGTGLAAMEGHPTLHLSSLPAPPGSLMEARLPWLRSGEGEAKGGSHAGSSTAGCTFSP